MFTDECGVVGNRDGAGGKAVPVRVEFDGNRLERSDPIEVQ